MKKGQGLSLNTIIIAAIVLIVLVVLWAIFTGRMGVFTKGIQEEDIKTRIEAERFYTGGLAAEAKCGSDGTCKPTCDNNKVQFLAGKPAEEQCVVGFVCCSS